MRLWLPFFATAFVACFTQSIRGDSPPESNASGTPASFREVRLTLDSFCTECHSAAEQESDLDLERFASEADVRRDLKIWPELIQQLEARQMPPEGHPQPSDSQREYVIAFARDILDQEARTRDGDPGEVPLHRLSNTQYDNTVHELTGVDLRPAREFPIDGAAGEGFTNAAESLRMSPAMMSKYIAAAKAIADHAVLLPDGFRFSKHATRRDWTDESLQRIREFYRRFTPDGALPLGRYVEALAKHREAVISGGITPEAVASAEGLSPQYIRVLWTALNVEPTSGQPMAGVQEIWRTAEEQTAVADQIVAEVTRLQAELWTTAKIGSYMHDVRDVPKVPGAESPYDAEAVDEFRRVFPPNVCYPHVIATDEVVCLKTFHREDEPLKRLFLDHEQCRTIDALWAEHRFITQHPVVENDYLPQFIGFVTQDQPKESVDFFEGKRAEFQQRADDFWRDYEAAAAKQLDQLTSFAVVAFRRPLRSGEDEGLRQLYRSLRDSGVGHDEAFRGVLSRVLISPSFLMHVEQSPASTKPQPVDEWELASRLSYFLWSSPPDERLRRAAAEGRLREPAVLEAEVLRMLRDDRVRSLAEEFGTQWIHVRGFDAFAEKNERLFPSFDADLRRAMYEEAILLFVDLFREDRPPRDLLEGDYAFLNQPLAEHYNISGVQGDHWRRVEGVGRYGRGGLLGLGSVQAKQAGASRTSPVLRGNWVVETLLGERLPLPPPNVPQLPDTPSSDGLTTRQIVELHVSDSGCAICHKRIDPFGFALERYDAIGRLRETDDGGLPLDTTARLSDGTEFEGFEGLREYLLKQRGDQFLRLFCQRLLGYALRRSVEVSDQPLIDRMAAAMGRPGQGATAAVTMIVRSPQFLMIRGSDYTDGYTIEGPMIDE